MMASGLALREEGSMKTEYQQRKAVSIRRMLGVTTAAISASTVLAFTPTKTSAFDLGGLVGTAMAIQQMQMGGYGYRIAPYYHSRGHVASRHDSDSDSSSNSSRSGGSGSSSGGGERDAREMGTMNQQSKVAARQSLSSSGSTRQASERDATATESGGSHRTIDDAPAYSPSR
jgi:hypothetical protein